MVSREEEGERERTSESSSIAESGMMVGSSSSWEMGTVNQSLKNLSREEASERDQEKSERYRGGGWKLPEIRV